MLAISRRRYSRAPIQATAEIKRSVPLTVEVTQIGEGGLFLKTEALYPVGTQLDLSIQSPVLPPAKFTVEVRWVIHEGQSPEDAWLQGMGCAFCEPISREVQELIRKHVARMQEVYSLLAKQLSQTAKPTPELFSLQQAARLEDVRDLRILKRRVSYEIKNLKPSERK